MQNKKILRLLAILFCLYLIVTTVKAIFDLWKAGDKLTDRQARVAALQKEQENILRQKAVAESPFYLEKVARDQMGLTKPGEEVIIIPKELLVDSLPVASQPAIPNWQKWVRLIF
jgi:cell division protein FtsB